MRNATRWQILENGKLRYVSRTAGEAGENECFRWVLDHTPFSFYEATTRQGFEVAPFEGRSTGQLDQRAA